MAKTNPFEFFQQVRQETRKVNWPSRRETIITTIMVLILSAVAALFFLGVDAILKWVVDLILFRT
jgi:preprotein translocase subunit SecE